MKSNGGGGGANAYSAHIAKMVAQRSQKSLRNVSFGLRPIAAEDDGSDSDNESYNGGVLAPVGSSSTLQFSLDDDDITHDPQLALDEEVRAEDKLDSQPLVQLAAAGGDLGALQGDRFAAAVIAVKAAIRLRASRRRHSGSEGEGQTNRRFDILQALQKNEILSQMKRKALDAKDEVKLRYRVAARARRASLDAGLKSVKASMDQAKARVRHRGGSLVMTDAQELNNVVQEWNVMGVKTLSGSGMRKAGAPSSADGLIRSHSGNSIDELTVQQYLEDEDDRAFTNKLTKRSAASNERASPQLEQRRPRGGRRLSTENAVGSLLSQVVRSVETAALKRAKSRFITMEMRRGSNAGEPSSSGDGTAAKPQKQRAAAFAALQRMATQVWRLLPWLLSSLVKLLLLLLLFSP